MSVRSFILFQEYKKHLSLLTREQKGAILDAIFEYNDGIEIELDAITKMAFSFIKADLEINNIKWEETRTSRIEAGRKGGLAKASKAKQTQAKLSKRKQTLANLAVNVNVNGNVNDSVNENINFESFWKMYDKKIDKVDAEKKFKASLKKDTYQNIISGLERYINTRGSDKTYWKNPSTWLHQECWRNEYTQTAAASGDSGKFAAYTHLKTGG